MKKKKIKVPKHLLVLLVMLAALIAPANVFAASKAPSCAATQNVYYARYASTVYGVDYSNFIYVKNIKKNAEIIIPYEQMNDRNAPTLRVVSSEKGAPIVAIYNWDSTKNVATVKFDVKQDGKTYHLKCKLIKKEAEFPFKSLKIGGKEYAKKYISSLQDGNWPKKSLKFTTSKSAKISVVPKSGVKITKISVDEKVIKNGGTADLSSKNMEIMIRFRYTKPNRVKNYNALQFKTVKEDYSYNAFIVLMRRS